MPGRSETSDEGFRQIAQLFELSLSIGTSLDLETSCESFLTVLMARKNLAYCALWLRKDAIVGPDRQTLSKLEGEELHLVWASPEIYVRERVRPWAHPMAQRAVSRGAFSVGSDEPEWEELIAHRPPGRARCAVFPLVGLGLLEVVSFVSGERFSDPEVGQLGTLVRKFAHAIEACLMHEQALAFAAVVAAKNLAETANKAKSEFLAKMSHELRTPLNAIIGVAELMRDSELSAAQHADLEQISLSADSLLRLVNDLLDISRIEAGQLVLAAEPFSLRTTVENSIPSLIRRAQLKGIEVSCRIAPDVPDALIGDSGRLQQILLNLVGNAIKFTERGKVEVEVLQNHQLGERVELEFSVKDTGPGIPDDQHKKIFELFVQGDAGYMHPEGVGLGLATSAQLVHLMGGRIWVESELGKGSRFYFTVDLGLAKPAELELPPTPLKGARVLIVENNSMSRKVLEEITSSWGMEPTSVVDGTACLQTLREAAAKGVVYRLLLVAFELPEQNGIELARTIRADPSLPPMPGILLAVLGDGEMESGARAAGLLERLEKPVSRSRLFEACKRALGIYAEPMPEAARAPSTRRLRVLLAEDNPINEALVRRMLDQLGHEAQSVNNGRAAIEAIERENFDVALIDYEMPVMNGLEAAKHVRQRERESDGHLPMIALTAYAMDEDRERLLLAGLDRVLTKPLRIDDLAEALIAVTREHRSAQERPSRRAEAGSDPPQAASGGDPRQAVSGGDPPQAASGGDPPQAASGGDPPQAASGGDPPQGDGSDAHAGLDLDPVEDVVDMSKVEALGGAETIAELSEMLALQMHQVEEEIRSAIAAGESDRLRLAAHTLKGSLLLFGASRAVVAAKRLEDLGRAKSFTGVEEAFEDLRSRIREVGAVLPRIKAEAARVETQEGSRERESSQV